MKTRTVLAVVILTGAIATVAHAENQAAKSASSRLGPGKLRYVTLVVKNQDEALRWYTEKLGFVKIEDQASPGGDRWLVVAPPGQKDLGIILYVNSMKQLDPETYQRRIGGETLWVFDTADAKAACAALKERGVKFVKELEDQPWGAQAIIEDLYGNQFVIVQPKPM
jgi:catechol 2,3-dioxygenase-like lactoylglutathione lyase family enzyme